MLERPRDEGHGDLATNLALKLAKPLRRPPRQVAEAIVEQLSLSGEVVSRTEVAGPGFINFWLAEPQVSAVIHSIVSLGKAFGTSSTGAGKRVNVEFVSANPTGPLHVGHGRGAALGDTVARLLVATGHDVAREFYVNDAGVQIDRLAESLWARVQQAVGREAAVPEGGYHGEYLTELATRMLEEEGREFADLAESEALSRCRETAVSDQREQQNRDMADFGITFDVVSSETALYSSRLVESTLEALSKRGHTYELDGAVWLKTAALGDTKDRVLKKSDGTYTYFMPDIAYHQTKAERGFERAIDVWGADHHGYVARMSAGMRALGLPEDFFEAVLVQLVRIERHGQEVKFSKRSGEFVTLRDLFEETGVDAARYFFLMRRSESQFVFDIDLATRQSEENPVYYVQYAHTRMAGIFRTANVAPEAVDVEGVDLAVLTEDEERTLFRRLADYPGIVSKAAEHLEPHRITSYLEELAAVVNRWYHRHRVLGAPEPVERARLVLARAVQIVLANGLNLLGVSAPERM